MAKTLHLNLKKQYFDAILSGEKKEEYRLVKEFWLKRLINKNSMTARFQEVRGGNFQKLHAQRQVLRAGFGETFQNFNHHI